MRRNLPNIALFVVLLAALAGGFWYIEKNFFPKPEPKQPEPTRELVMALTGGIVHPTKPAVDWKTASVPDIKPPEAPKEQPKPVPVAAPIPAAPQELIALGNEKYYKKVLLNTKGGAVQEVILTRFDTANKLGVETRGDDNKAERLRIIPGQIAPKVSLSDLHADPHADRIPGLTAGVVPPHLLATLAEPSYVVLHYPAEDDPKREAKDAGKMNDDFPSSELGERTWTVVEKHTGDDECRVVFETSLGAPYHLKLRKTYTLAAKDYHVGLKLDIIATGERTQRKGKFKYQIAGPRQTHIEGIWYTQVFRNVMIGWQTPSGGAKRQIEDAATIQSMHGGDAVLNAGNTFTYAAVASQYFASALAIDDRQSKDFRQRMWDYVRATREPGKNDDPNQPFLSDVTFRAVASTLDPAANETVSHGYLIYDGPAKVRLLHQLGAHGNRPDSEVSDENVDLYLYKLDLRTITDYHSPNFFGRFANAIWWTDLVIVFTNLMHTVLGWLHLLNVPWGVAIMLLTVCVRLILLIPSRKQQIMMVRMQEKMARMKPEMEKLAEKHKDNPQLLQQEKTRLMLAHGVNPLSTMGGCLLMFAQMPIFMGLYFCLQESVFFRQEGFLWFPNLSAPDMTVWWSESIPWLSTPENLGGAIYLGPFWNVLPILAVALIFIQQKLTMPPPTDEQQEMQQKMMKIMIVVMAVFFYKVAAGLCLYFICSTTWALAERKLIPKPQPATIPPVGAAPPDGGAPATTPAANGSGGGIMAKLKAKLEAMKDQADAQSQRQIRNDGTTPPKPDRRDKKKKRK